MSIRPTGENEAGRRALYASLMPSWARERMAMDYFAKLTDDLQKTLRAQSCCYEEICAEMHLSCQNCPTKKFYQSRMGLENHYFDDLR